MIKPRNLVVATVAAVAMLVLVSSATPAAAVGGGTSQAGFTTPLKLQGSDGFGEPSIVSGSGRLVVTAPNGLLTTAIADQPSPVWISTDGGSSFQGPIYPQDAGVFGEPLGEDGVVDLAENRPAHQKKAADRIAAAIAALMPEEQAARAGGALPDVRGWPRRRHRDALAIVSSPR